VPWGMMGPERWRELCASQGENVWALIIQLLQFAAREDPPEFRRRRDRIGRGPLLPGALRESQASPGGGANGAQAGAKAGAVAGAQGDACTRQPGPSEHVSFVPSGWEAPHAATSAADESGRVACPEHTPRETQAAAPAQSAHTGGVPGGDSRPLPSAGAWDPLPQQSNNRSKSSQNRQLGERQGQGLTPQRRKQEQGKERGKEGGKEESGTDKPKPGAPSHLHESNKTTSLEPLPPLGQPNHRSRHC